MEEIFNTYKDLIQTLGAVAGILSFLVALVALRNNTKRKTLNEYYIETEYPKKYLEDKSPEDMNNEERQSIALKKEIDTYKKNEIAELYESRLSHFLSWIHQKFDEPKEVRSFKGLLSIKSYEFCLILAFIYPILFATLNGVFSLKLAISEQTLFEFESHLEGLILLLSVITFTSLTIKKFGYIEWKDHLLLFSLVVIFISITHSTVAVIITIASLFTIIFSVNQNLVFSMLIGSIYILVGAITIASIGSNAATGALVLLVSIMTMVVIIGSSEFGTRAFIGILIGVLVGILISIFLDVDPTLSVISIVVALAGGYILNKIAPMEFDSVIKYLIYEIFLFVFLSICIVTSVFLAKGDKSEIIFMPLILGIFPLLNGPVDWLSLNVTRYFSYKILEHKGKFSYLIGLGLLDLLAAIFFMALITGLMLTVLAGINGLSMWVAGKEVLPLDNIMQALIDPKQRQQYYWVHFMVLSTLIPTVIHFLLVLLSAAIWPITHMARHSYQEFWSGEPRHRLKVFNHVQRKNYYVAFVSVTIVALLGYGIFNFNYAGCVLWSYADFVLNLLDPMYTSPAQSCWQ